MHKCGWRETSIMKDPYLYVIIIIANNKAAGATLYIMYSPTNFQNMSITIDSTIFPFLQMSR